jgi:hypothetical protein
MRCSEAMELMSGALDQALAADEATALQAHVADCAVCLRRQAELGALAGALGTLARTDAPAPAALRARLAATYGGGEAVLVTPARPGAVRHRRWAYVAAAVAAAAVLVLWLVPLRSASEGWRHVAERTTLALGRRGVAVAEAGSELRWQVDRGGAAHLMQLSGDVFYRVERGGAFVVESAAGTVTVHGTCFRVALRGGVAIVTVYEGRVGAASGGGSVELTAGQRARLAPTVSPHVEDLAAATEDVRAAAPLAVPPATPLPTPPSAVPANPRAATVTTQKFFGFSGAELDEMAQRCQVTFDLPLFGLQPALVGDSDGASLGLSESARQTYNAILQRHNEAFLAEARGLYQEIAGQPGDQLTYRALEAEILNKSIPSDVQAARARLSAERAGRAVPPPEGRQPPVERFLRLGLAAADALEADVARALGSDTARALRRTRFQVVWTQGCPSP